MFTSIENRIFNSMNLELLYVIIFLSLFKGMQFSQAVCIMQSQVATMKKVQVIYNENVNFIKVLFELYSYI